ncbi:MAG: site-specific integrase [Pirellulales bacterium]|nr:site-specific integrase [Pirellulales bacterium]
MFKVTVCGWGDGRPLMLRWTDPATGQRRAKSSGTSNKREAERRAAALEKELREGKHGLSDRISWQDFTWRYADEVLCGLAHKTRAQLGTVFNTVERTIHPKRLADVTAARLSGLVSTLRVEGKSEITIRNYLAHLHAALRWAADMGFLVMVPKFPKMQRAKHEKMMKGRPISGEEFERILEKVPAVVGAAAADSWRDYLWGLWYSGLRLRESLELSWDQGAGLAVDLSHKFPMLLIRGDFQKSGKDQLYPLAPEFAEMLLAVPPEKRRGRVFRLLGTVNQKGGPAGIGPVSGHDWVGRVISRIGEAANVKVDVHAKRNHKTGEAVEVVKYASAHDLRRSFGFRWSRRVMPAELRELMRHSDISTTMQFYVGRNAQSTAATLWAAYQRSEIAEKDGFGNTFGNNSPVESNPTEQKKTQAIDR